MVRLAQALLAQIEQAQRARRARASRFISARRRPASRSCARVCTRRARRLGQHPMASQHLESACGDRCSSTSSDHALLNEASRTAAAADRRGSGRSAATASPAKNGAMSTPVSAAPLAAFQAIARPLPQPRSTSDRRRRAAGTAAACRCRIFEPSTGGAIDSCRASACSSSSRYFVCSANAVRGRRSRYPPPVSNDRPQPVHGRGRVPARATPRSRGSGRGRPGGRKSCARGASSAASSRSALASQRELGREGVRASRRATAPTPGCRRASERGRERRCIARRHEQGRPALREHFGERRQIGGHDRPGDRRYSNSLRAKYTFGNRRGRVRQHEHGRARERGRDLARRDESRERRRGPAIPSSRTRRLEARQIALGRMAAHDQTSNARRERERFDEDVHALPRIEVPGVAATNRARVAATARPCAGEAPSGTT